MSFRDAYREVAEQQELTDSVTIEGMLKNYSHLGTPGNSGLVRLKKILKDF